MDNVQSGNGGASLVQEILGYLNYSSGSPEPKFLKNVDELFGRLESAGAGDESAWKVLGNVLRAELTAVRGTSDAFREVGQAEGVIAAVFDSALPAYREFHRDLLFHQTEESMFRPFFIGRMFEAVLQQGGPWDQRDRIASGAVRQLNDYIGHRPVATLRTDQKIQPYEHEWVRPIPLWIRGAGAAAGPYKELVETAMAILDANDSEIMFEAGFSLEQLDELAVDPRAYDFDHPVNKRPNYLFGQWDMNCLDNAGKSRRFILQQATLDAMIDRLQHHGRLSRGQVLFEESAVLAGTMLMGSGVSGNRPDSHDSTVTLATLVEKIARYRDAFYDRMLQDMKGPHAERLRAEALALRQPFGGARQSFNHFLADRRAQQLQHVHVAQLFAAIGYVEAAERHVAVVPAASARMTCRMRCRLAAAHLAVERGNLQEAASQLPPVEDLLHRAIECGAMVDPWNILGFGGQYGLFPAIENSIHDHRVDELLDMMSDILTVYVRIHKAAAAAGDKVLQESLLKNLGVLSDWWDKYATTEVGSVEGVSGQDTLESARRVAAALQAWHEGGAAAGDLAFWRQHVEQFHSPKAYALVIETLLDHRDPVAAMALLVQWLGQAEEISLVDDDYSFHDLALLWMEDLWHPEFNKPKTQKEESPGPEVSEEQRWSLSRKLLDYLESNAEEYWQVPQFDMAAEALGNDGILDESPEDEEPEDDEGDLFGAAYEHVTYRDSTDDGVEGEMFETGEGATDFEMVGEAERIIDRLTFLTTLAQLWKLAATASSPENAADRDDVLSGWLGQAEKNRRQLLDLMSAVHRYRIPAPRGTHESLIEYDQRRSVKETLLEEIIEACAETGDAARVMRVTMENPPKAAAAAPWERQTEEVLAALFRSDAERVRRAWPKFLSLLAKQPLLYVALARGGNPQRIVAARTIHYLLRRLLEYLPRLGLLAETCRLMETAQRMEMINTVGPGAITEFDRIFEIGCQAITECLVVSSAEWRPAGGSRRRGNDKLIDMLEQVIEVLLRCWLMHSHGVRLSVLESVHDPQRWNGLKQFIERYGSDLFTQRFLNMGNLRGILHQGTQAYLETLIEADEPEEDFLLLQEIGVSIDMDEASHWLSVAIESVVENYGEYVDYNSITTQSDRGDMLYTLLDFLRLSASYDRLAWNLRPVILAHEVLVRLDRDDAAEIWRRAVSERTVPIAEEHLKRFDKLCKKYGMRLPSIAEHLSERFIRPLEIDRLCALVRPAVDEIRGGESQTALRQIEEHISRLTKEPAGAGFELPSWLQALEQELDRASWKSPDDEDSDLFDPLVNIPQVNLSRIEAERQIKRMAGETVD